MKIFVERKIKQSIGLKICKICGICGKIKMIMNRFITHFKVWSAAFMLVAGVALSVAGFAVAPVGEIHDSVLWYFAQCLIYAGSAVGIDVIIDKRVRDHQNP